MKNYSSKPKTSLHCETCDKREKSVFCDLSEKHCEEIDSTKTTNIYQPRQIIFYEGNHPYGLYCINSGKVKIYKTDPAQGNHQIVRLAGAGDILGYRCLLSGESYTATAETLEEATICFIDKNSFFHLLQTHPKTASNVMTLLATDLGHAEKQLLNLSHKNIRERLAEIFLVLKNKYGRKTGQGIELEIELTRQEMADLIGTTQESLIRLISDFKKEGLVLAKGRKITLCNLPKLIEAANLFD